MNEKPKPNPRFVTPEELLAAAREHEANESRLNDTERAELEKARSELKKKQRSGLEKERDKRTAARRDCDVQLGLAAEEPYEPEAFTPDAVSLLLNTVVEIRETTPDESNINQYRAREERLRDRVTELATHANVDETQLWEQATLPQSMAWRRAFNLVVKRDRPIGPDTKKDKEKIPTVETADMLRRYNKLLAENPQMTHTDIVNEFMEQKPDTVRKAAVRYPHLVPNKRSGATGHGPDTD